MKEAIKKDKRVRICGVIFGITFGVASVLGAWLVKKSQTPRGLLQLMVFLCLFAAATVIYSLLGMCLIYLLGAKKTEKPNCPETDTGASFENGKAGDVKKQWAYYLTYVVFILICWGLVFLAYYPSVFSYDAEGQMYQSITGQYSTHHPLIHTLMMELFFKLGGNVLGSYAAGMALYSIVQMILMALMLSYALIVLYRLRTPRFVRVLILLFYALFPTNSVLSVSTTKDVLFSGLVLVFTFLVYESVATGKLKTMPIILSGVLMLLFRNNAVYALLGAGVITLFFAGPWRKNVSEEKSKNNKLCTGLLLSYGIILVIYLVGAFGLKTALHAENGSPREMLSIPLQQMARVRMTCDEKIPADLRNECEKYIEKTWVDGAYNPYLADPVKSRAVLNEDPVGFVKAWIKLGVKFPGVYIDAFLECTRGMWYVSDESHATIYGYGTESGFGYLSTDMRRMPEGFEVNSSSKLPGLRVFMEKIVSDNAYLKVPVVRLLFAPATYTWLMMLYLMTLIYRREYKLIVPILFLSVYFFTLLLSPAVLVRYMYPFFLTVPVLLGTCGTLCDIFTKK